MFTKNFGINTFPQMSKKTLILPAAIACTMASTANAGEWSANASMTNNYIWRGLTQSENEAAVQGGIDYAADSGFYMGTWASNVNYGGGDTFSYEHDVYAGYAFDAGGVSWDVGYLYYNYDSQAKYDFGEVYIGMGLGDFGITYSLLANTEADEPEGADFGFGEASYLSLDYGFELSNGVAVGLHFGHHEGDFAYDFNVTDGSYNDYNITFSKDGFTFMITDTDVGGDSAGQMYDNDSVKFVVSYGVDISM
jgi:uncharacterized protein (TIGR02001 family)